VRENSQSRWLVGPEQDVISPTYPSGPEAAAARADYSYFHGHGGGSRRSFIPSLPRFCGWSFTEVVKNMHASSMIGRPGPGEALTLSAMSMVWGNIRLVYIYQ